MVYHNVIRIHWLFLTSFAVAISSPSLFSANQPSKAQIFSSTKVGDLREGDIVFRAGRGWRSEVIKSVSSSTLTHVGIVDVTADGQVYVIHAEPSEGYRMGKVRRERLAAFTDANRAITLLAFRPDLDADVLREAVSAANRFSQRSVPFDDDFDLATDNALYCSEMIWKAFVEAGVPLEPVQTSITFPGMTGYYLMPEDIMAMIPGRQV